jgi:hypothetical protein
MTLKRTQQREHMQKQHIAALVLFVRELCAKHKATGKRTLLAPVVMLAHAHVLRYYNFTNHAEIRELLIQLLGAEGHAIGRDACQSWFIRDLYFTAEFTPQANSGHGRKLLRIVKALVFDGRQQWEEAVANASKIFRK